MVRPRPSTTTIPRPETLATLNVVPGDDDAEVELDEAEEEVERATADDAAVLLLEELPQAARVKTPAVAHAAMYKRRLVRRSRPGTRIVIMHSRVC